MKRDEIITFAAIGLLMVLMAYAIISTARDSSLSSLSSYGERGREEAAGHGPAIERCDKPLWDRVRSLCDDDED